MTRVPPTLPVLALLALGGCAATADLEPRPLAADQMPVTFAYGDLARGQRSYTQVQDPRYGTRVRRMIAAEGGEWAMVDVRSTIGNRVYRSVDPKQLASGMLKPELQLTWNDDGGTILDSSAPVHWRTFTLDDGDDVASCLAMVRNLRSHNQAGLGTWSKELVAGIYCRDGTGGIPSAEVPAIAGALRTRA